jgi:hypothetical protein
MRLPFCSECFWFLAGEIGSTPSSLSETGAVISLLFRSEEERFYAKKR